MTRARAVSRSVNGSLGLAVSRRANQATSLATVNWEYDFWDPAYGLNVRLTNGSEYCLTSRERPKKLFSYGGRDFLTNSGCPSGLGPGDTGCFTWMQELKKPAALKADDGSIAPSPPARNLSVDVASSVLHIVSEKVLSFAMDTCGVVGTCGEVDWQGSKLRYLASQLAPANLRLGGSGASCVTYILPGRTARLLLFFFVLKTWNTTGPCKSGQHNLTMETSAHVLDFVEAAGLQFTFDLNELAGRACHDQDDPAIKHMHRIALASGTRPTRGSSSGSSRRRILQPGWLRSNSAMS